MAVAINSIGLITKYSPEYFDKVYKQEAVTSVFDANRESVKFTGAKTVKIGKLQLGGLANYYRNHDQVPNVAGSQSFYGSAGFGYQRSQMNYAWEEFTLTQDRAAAFPIEYFDDEEAGGEVVGRVVTEVSRTVIVPEVDAYALSTIAEKALGTATGYQEPGKDPKPLAAINAAFEYFENNEVPAEDQVIFASPAFMKDLRQTGEVTRFLGEEVRDRGVNYKITTYEGRDIITVSPRRLHTGFKALEGGYTFEGGAPINFLACAKSAIYHVVKYEKVKVISGDMNLAANGFDGYTVYARIYHDVFVPDNKRYAIYVNLGTGAKANVTLDIKTDSHHKITAISTEPADILCSVVTGTKENGKVTSPVKAKVDDTVTQGAKYYAVNANNEIMSNEADPFPAGK